MGARFIAGTVEHARGFQNCIIKSDKEFSFDYQTAGAEIKTYNVYVPTRADYEISVEVVDRAINIGCTVIVYDSWIFFTKSGNDYAKSRGIAVFNVGEFMKTILSGEKIDF